MEKKPVDPILPQWMIRQVTDDRSKKISNYGKSVQTTLFQSKNEIKINKNPANLNENFSSKRSSGNQFISNHVKDSTVPVDNFLSTYECGVQCEKILNLLDNSEKLVLGLELDWPSEYKNCVYKTSTVHICFGENQCIYFNVRSLQKLPLAFTLLIKHPNVKLVGHNLINDLNKLKRDFNFDTKTVLEQNILKESSDLNLYCEIHNWSYYTLNEQTVESPIEPSIDESFELKFKGKTYYYTEFQDIAEASEKLLSLADLSPEELVLGFDQEWPPTATGKVSLMQICPNEHECYIFQFSGIRSLPKVLLHLLKHPKVKITGLNIKNDIRKLGKDFKIDVFSILNNNTIELSTLANQVLNCFERWSLARIVLNQFGVSLSKDPKVRCSNWANKDLSEAQLMYAATDAYASLLCYLHLDRLRRRNNIDENGCKSY
ncbi:hypothetical protein O3M35_010070 [Rhynocoris fuscipes]|uniref:3'-5' exonuclease n=1 Tax=Rhynocoris fuscipes TaxID=488301 RepID=A0AAW1CYJ9_9HEMI